MHQIVLFMHPKKYDYDKHTEIGNLFLNRFAIEEDANFEILKIIYLEDNYRDIIYDEEKGKGLMIGKELNNYCTVIFVRIGLDVAVLPTSIESECLSLPG